MGLTAVVENLRALKKSVKKPIVAFRETVHNVYTKAYVGSPERVDELYNYIKVYQPSQHNDLCMMSITADINRFSMLPDKHTFFHVHKLERHFDRMIAARKQADVNGDMAIQILSGHNMTFMARYRRYKTRAAAKEAKRNAKRHMALNVKRHSQMPVPQSSGSDSDASQDAAKEPEKKPEKRADAPILVPLSTVTVGISGVESGKEEEKEEDEDNELAEISKAISEVVMVCELTKPETVVAELPSSSLPIKSEDLGTSRLKAKKILKTSEKTKVAKKFKVARPVKKVVEKTEKPKKLENVMAELSLEQHLESSDDNSEFENVSSDSSEDSDGSDIEELEKIEEKDVDDLEYEMV